MIAPTLETARLRLRGHVAADFADSFAMWSDPAVTRFIGGRPSTEQQTWARLLGYAGQWQLLHFGYWVARLRDTDAFVGEIGFADYKRAIVPAMRDVPEVGFALAAAYHGRGLASEALAAVIAWGDRHLASSRTVCLISPDNVASVRLAERFGYRSFSMCTYNEQPVRLFERVSAEDRAEAGASGVP